MWTPEDFERIKRSQRELAELYNTRANAQAQADLVRASLVHRMTSPSPFVALAGVAAGMLAGRFSSRLFNRLGRVVARTFQRDFPALAKLMTRGAEQAGSRKIYTFSNLAISQAEAIFKARTPTRFGVVARQIAESQFAREVLSPASYLAAAATVHLLQPGANYNITTHVALGSGVFAASRLAQPALAKIASPMLSHAEFYPFIYPWAAIEAVVQKGHEAYAAFRKTVWKAQKLSQKTGLGQARSLVKSTAQALCTKLLDEVNRFRQLAQKHGVVGAFKTLAAFKYQGLTLRVAEIVYRRKKAYAVGAQTFATTAHLLERLGGNLMKLLPEKEISDAMERARNIFSGLELFEKVGENAEELERLAKIILAYKHGGSEIFAASLDELKKFGVSKSKIAKNLGYETARMADILSDWQRMTDVGWTPAYWAFANFVARDFPEFAKLPLGPGLYVSPKKQLVFMPTLGQHILEMQLTVERHFTIPYLDFNIASLFQPRLWREYLYQCPLTKELHYRHPIPTKQGVMSGQEILTKVLGKPRGGIAAIGRNLYAFDVTEKGINFVRVPETLVPAARYIRAFELPGSILRAYAEETETYIRGRWEFEGGRWVPKFTKQPPKWAEAWWARLFIPKYWNRTSETFFGRIKEAFTWPWRYMKMRREIAAHLAGVRAIDFLASNRMYFEAFEMMAEDVLSSRPPYEIDNELGQVFLKLLSLERGKLNTSFFERALEPVIYSELAAGGVVTSLSERLAKLPLTREQVVKRTFGMYLAMLSAMENIDAERVAETIARNLQPDEADRLIEWIKSLGRAKEIIAEHFPDVGHYLKEFRELPHVRYLVGVLEGRTPRELETVLRELVGSTALEYTFRQRLGTIMPLRRLYGLPGIGGLETGEWQPLFRGGFYMPFFEPFAQKYLLREPITSPVLRKIVSVLPDSITRFFEYARGVMETVSPSKYQGGRVNVFSTLMHWLFERPIELAEFVGLGGINPYKAHGFIQLTQRLFKDIVLPLTSIMGGVALMDQLIDAATPGINQSPRGWAFDFLSNMYVGTVAIANVSGLGPLMRYMRENFPGLVPTIAGFYGYIGGGIIPAITFQSIAALATQAPTTREAVLQVEGVTNVPVREGYGWEFGRTPYLGGRVRYYRPSWFYLQRIGYQWTPGMYGSKLEYFFLGGRPPSIFNLFGLTQLISPMHYERKLQLLRPYAISGSLAVSEIPFFGLLAFAYPQYYFGAVVLDQIVKRGKMLLDEHQISSAQGAYALMNTATTLGYSSMLEALQKMPQMPADILALNRDLIRESRHRGYSVSKYVYEYLGIFGFMFQNILEPPDLYNKAGLQTSDWMSIERSMYSWQLGNILGISEFFRRAWPRDQYGYPTFSPLINYYMVANFPWMPRRFFFGDPYAQIDMGEVRLPGPTFAYARGLYDNYGPIDALRILSSAQPFSMQYRMIRRWVEENVLSKDYDLVGKYLAMSQIEEGEEVGRLPVEWPPFTTKVESITVSVAKYLGRGVFETTEGTKVVLRGLILDPNRLAKRIFETKNVTLDEAYQEASALIQGIEQRLASMEHSTISLIVPKDTGLRYVYEAPDEVYMQAVLNMAPSDFPREILDDSNWLAKRWIYGTGPLRRLWERFAHQYGFWHEKFIPVRTPVEEYERYRVLGTYTMLWHRPFKYIIAPSFLNTIHRPPLEAVTHQAFVSVLATTSPGAALATWWMSVMTVGTAQLFTGFGVNVIKPPSAREIEEIEAEQLALEYIKGSNRSLLAMKNLRPLEALAAALPRRERDFLAYFANQPVSERERISQLVPPYLSQLLQYIWMYKDTIAEGGVPSPQQSINTEDVQKQLYNIIRNQQLLTAQNVIDVNKYAQLRQAVDVGDLRKGGWTQWWVGQAVADLLDYSFLENQYWSEARYVTRQLLTLHEHGQDLGQSNVRFGVMPGPEEVNVAYG